MLIKYNQPGIFAVQVGGHLDEKGNPVGVGARTVTIMPGASEISKEDWLAIKEDSILQAQINSGKIEVLSEDDDAAESKLSELKPNDAVKLVKETIVLDILEMWAKKEDRKVVAKALQDQIAALKAPAKLRDGTISTQVNI